MIVDRNHERKSIELLIYALDLEGVSRQEYEIFELNSVVDGHEITGLQKQTDGHWWVFGVVYGEVKRKVVFQDHAAAMEYFYSGLVGIKSPWDYREKWEKETGKVF